MAHFHKVMVSSSFRDLKAERMGVGAVIQGQGMLALMMETDSAIPDRGLLVNSLKMVDAADLYVLLLSNYRYGQIIADADLNPNGLSVTELEFERAEARGLPICVFLMDEAVPSPLPPAELADALRDLDKLRAFRARAQHHCRVTTDFFAVADLREKMTKTLSDWRLERLTSHDPGSAAAGPSADPPTVPRPERCLGRAEDSAKVVAALCAGGVPTAVLVQGPGGIGKTTLTQDVANHPDVLARFGPRRWLVALETATDRDTFDAALLTAIGLDPTVGFAAAPRRLGQAPTLLVLDNLETAWERAGPAIEARLGELAAVPGVALMASFRGQEAVGGVRWSLRCRVEPLRDDEARALFLEIADTIAADDRCLADLLGELGGVPLAICLTARRAARRWELAGLWAEWQRVGVELAQWQGVDAARLTSVAHSIELSLRSPRLAACGLRLFGVLGQVPAGLAAADRDALLGGEAFAAEDGLLGVGLAHHRAGRLDLLPPVRDHARRSHPPEGEDATAWCRYFLGLAREQGGRIGQPGGAEALARLTPEVANLDAALNAAVGLSLREIAVAAVDGICHLFSASGAGSIAALRALAQDCHAAIDPHGEAVCCLCAGVVALNRSDHATARALFERARPLYQRVGSVLGEANCIKRLGDIARARGDHAGARALFEQARSLYRQIGAVRGEANCIKSLGDIALARGDHAAAWRQYEQARPLYQQSGAVQGEANCIASLGDCALVRSDQLEARVLYEQARPLYQQVGSVQGEANCIRGLAEIARARGDHAAARALYEQARPMYQQVGEVLGEANCIHSLGDIALARCDYAAARVLFAQAGPLYQQVGDVLGEANCLYGLGQVALARGDHAAARVLFERARLLYQQFGSVLGEANCVSAMGDVAWAEGDPVAARTPYAQALELYEQLHCTQNLPLAHEDLARVTTGAERAGHVAAARAAWAAMDLPDEVARVEREFG